MADKVLSQEEVDALMKGVAAGEIETETDRTEDLEGVRTYDLTSQDRVVRGRMPAMEVIGERFRRLFKTSLFNFIKKVVDIEVEGPNVMRYGEFIEKIPLPASFNIFQISPLKGMNLLVFDAQLIFLIVDNYFGGGGKHHTKIEGREFTILEQRIIRRLVDIVFGDMKVSWESVHKVDFIHNRSEINPQFIEGIAPTEVVLVVTFSIEIDGVVSKMRMCIPYPTIEPIKEKLYAISRKEGVEEDKRWLERLEREIRGVHVRLSCEIGKAEITIKDFLDLEVGDIIQLDKRPSEPVVVNVEGRSKFYGMTGLYQGQYAVQVVGSIYEEVNDL